MDWESAWNAHDIDLVLSHYKDDFEMSSPIIAQLVGEASGTLKGKTAVGDYWRLALEKVPNLKFEVLSVLLGANTLTIYYKGAQARLSAEVFEFGACGKVVKAIAHYEV